MVNVKDLTVKFKDFTAVDSISFSVSHGEIFGLLGANGAGKTTTIRVLLGLLIPTSGEVIINDLNIASDPEKVKNITGYMSQKFTLYDDLTVDENLNFIGGLRDMSGKRLNERKNEILSLISFSADRDRLVKELPGGIRQQVSLAASIIHDPLVVFLDEPTAGVSPQDRAKFWDLIRKLSRDGKILFVTTHYMDEAEMCGRIALMKDGKIVALDSPSALKKNIFPDGLYELTPKSKITDDHRAKYGLVQHGSKYHSGKFVSEMSRDFLVKKIDPTLEDVFIRVVEGTR